jgi:hypothetical protein
MTNRISEIRNPKHEIRDKSKTQISKAQNKTDQTNMRVSAAACARACFGHSSFGFLYCPLFAAEQSAAALGER